MKWFPYFVECNDLVEAGLYPGGTRCCRGCHKHNKRNEKVFATPPSKDSGEVETMDEYEGGTPIGRIMTSFCCEVGHVALSRDEIAKLIWQRRRHVAIQLRNERENSLFRDDGIQALGEMLQASVH